MYKIVVTLTAIATVVACTGSAGAQCDFNAVAKAKRLSLNDPTGGDVTVVDLPLTFAFETPTNGQIKLNGNSAQALAAILADINDAALPTCTSMQVIRVRLNDPEGLPFAELGVSTRAKDE